MSSLPMPSKAIVVIPVLNEEAYLDKLLRKLGALDPECVMSFVVVDGGSLDRTPKIARSLAAETKRVLFLENPKRIQSAAVNLAVATYGDDAEFLIRIDAHADYPKGYCQTLLDEAEKAGAKSVVVAMKTSGRKGFQRGVAAAQNSILGNGGSAHRSGGKEGCWIDHGHHALMRVAAFREIGGYDESFVANEDAEFDIRFRKKGHGIWLTRKTTMTYYPRSEPLALFRQYMNYGYGRAQTLMKHHIKPKLRQSLPAFVLPAFVLAVIGWGWPLAELPFLFWFATCLFYGVWLAYKAKDVTVGLSGPAAMIMHLGWSIGFWRAVITKIDYKKFIKTKGLLPKLPPLTKKGNP